MRIRCWLAAAAVSLLVPQAASAEEAVEAAIRSWVAALDATPDWSATFGGLIYDPASDTALLTDLAIRAEPTAAAAGTVVTLATLSVTGYVEGPDGFKVRSVAADGGTLEAGFVKLRLADIGFEDLSVPSFIGFTLDEAEAVHIDNECLSRGAEDRPARRPDRVRRARPDPRRRHQQGRLRQLPHRRFRRRQGRELRRRSDPDGIADARRPDQHDDRQHREPRHRPRRLRPCLRPRRPM